MSIYQGNNLLADTANGAIGDVSIENRFYSFGSGAVPDYANRETIERITVSGGTWIADRDGFVQAGATFSSATGRVTIGTTGASVFQLHSSIANTPVTALLPVARGQSVMVSITAGTVTAITCRFIPPLTNVIPSKTAPQTWSVGTEVNFGDSTFGRRFTGNIVNVASQNNLLDLATGVAANLTIISCGGWWEPGNSTRAAVNGSLWASGTPPVNMTYSAMLYSVGGTIRFGSWTNIARSGTANNRYNIFVIYTKE